MSYQGLLTKDDVTADDDDGVREERDAKKRLHVKKYGAERSIRLLVVVEEFRLALHLSFIALTIVGAILTKVFVEGDIGKSLRSAFGMVSICVYYDYPPSSYVLPSLWSISLLFIYGYGITSIFRAWVSKEEGHITRASFIVYTVLFLYVILSFIFFTTIFAVQPDLPAKPTTMIVHGIPYSNLSVAMFVLAVLVTWFGEKVAWENLLPRFLVRLNRIMVAVQSTTVVVKLFSQLNAMVGLANGSNGVWAYPWFNPHKGNGATLAQVVDVFDYLFLITVVAWPTILSGFLTYKRHQTHCVYVSLEDNREGKDERMKLNDRE